MDFYITYNIILLCIIILLKLNDGLIRWITFDIIRFKVFLSFIYFYYIFFKHWQISVELFHIPSLSRKDLTGIQG